MKKPYSKPTLYFEALALGSGAASGCEAIANFAEMVCSISLDLGGGEIIDVYQLPEICMYSTPDVKDFVCYHAPSDSNNVFSS